MIDYSVLPFKTSFGLTSTNPKLTTNIKLMVDSSENLFLESFDANPELSNFKFKKVQVSQDSAYAKDLYRFYNYGKFPKKFAYANFKEASDIKILTDFNKQHETMYKSGCEKFISKLYDENLAMFAPIWLEKEIPSYFVVFRAKGDSFSNFREDVLFKSEIIKTFDLTENSKLGKYIRNHQKTLQYAPIELNMAKNEMSYINGIDYITGTSIKKGKYIYDDFINNDKSVIEYDYLLTKAFENNDVILPNILNLQFLFDDDLVDDYELNRYFGLYVTEIPDGNFNFDVESLYTKKHLDRFQIVVPEELNLIKDTNYIKNKDGCLIHIKNLDSDVGFPDFTKIKDLNSLFYIKDVDSNFYLLNLNNRWKDNQLRITNKYLDITKFETSQLDTTFVPITKIKSEAKASVVFEVLKDIPSAFGIKFYNSDGEIGAIYSDQNLTKADIESSDFYFIGEQKPKVIAKSIANAINSLDIEINAFSDDTFVFVQSKFYGEKFNSLRFEFETSGWSSSLFINEYSNSQYFKGGSNANSYRYKFPIEDVYPFGVKEIRTIDGLKTSNLGFSVNSISDFQNYAEVSIGSEPVVINSNLILETSYKSEFGRFHIFPVKAFDTDFYSKNYVNDYELEIEKEHYSSNPIVQEFYEENKIEELDGIENEYAVLSENSNIDFSTVSRVAPFINKWVFKNSKDCRGYDYKVNPSSSIGTYNRIPALLLKNQNISQYTHDWFLMNPIPDYYMDVDIKNSYSYIGETYFNADDFLDTENDNFLEAFYRDSLDGTSLEKSNIYYSIFENGSDSSFATTFFKGMQIRIKRREETSDINYNVQNLSFLKDISYNDYKFATVLLNDYITAKPTRIKVIKNEKFKSVALLIYVGIDYKEVLDKTLLYVLNNKLNETETEPADVTMKGALDLEGSSYSSINKYYSIKGTLDKDNIPTEFIKQIKIDENGKFFSMAFDANGVNYYIEDIFNILNNDTLLCRTFDKDENNGLGRLPVTSFPITSPNSRELTYLNYDINISDDGYLIKKGGYNVYKNILSEISFANFAEYVNKGNPSIEYSTVTESGELVNNDFVIEVIKPEMFIKPLYIEKTVDQNKPIVFNFIDVIGYNIAFKEDVELAPFYRHNGYYTPKFKNIFDFKPAYVNDIENDSYKESVYNKTRYLNTNISNINDIENVFYHKATNNSYKILELEDVEGFQSKYPLINEYGIDYEDVNVFNTNANLGHYKNYVDKNIYNTIALKGQKEKKNLFGSKLMITPNTIDIEYNITYASIINEGNNITFSIDMTDTLINYFISKMPDDFTENEKIAYIKNNVTPLYEVKNADMYVKESRDGTGINLEYMDVNNYQKGLANLTVDNKFIQTFDTNSINFTLVYNISSINSYKFGLSITVSII